MNFAQDELHNAGTYIIDTFVIFLWAAFQIYQNSQENISVRVSFLIKLQASACNFIKKRDSGTGAFYVNFKKFLRITF